METLTLILPHNRYTALYEAANGRGKTAHIPRQDLFALLQDHQEALARLEELKVSITNG